MNIELNTFERVSDITIKNTITPLDWLKLNQENNHISTISEIRDLKKLFLSTKKLKYDKEYKELKRTLPVVTWTAIYHKEKCNKNFQAPTGYLYIDIDDSNFDIKNLDTNKIFAYHKSVGGLGYSVIVQVEGITVENYSSTFDSITDDLSISQYIDRKAKKLVQVSIISLDPDVFINTNSFVFSCVKPTISKCTDGHINNQKREKHNVWVGTKSKLRFNNIDDFEFDNQEFIEDWNEGIKYIECNKPFIILTDGRKRYMMNYIRNLVYLNPNADYCLLLNTMLLVNLSVGEEPLNKRIIESQFKSILKQKQERTLTPKVKIRKLIFNPKSLLSKLDKQKLRGQRQHIYYANKSTGIINDSLEDWNFTVNGKITIRKVAEISGIAKSTVTIYWNEFKFFSKDLNSEHDAEIKLFKQHKKLVSKDIIENDITPYMEDMTPENLQEQLRIELPTVEINEVELDDNLDG